MVNFKIKLTWVLYIRLVLWSHKLIDNIGRVISTKAETKRSTLNKVLTCMHKHWSCGYHTQEGVRTEWEREVQSRGLIWRVWLCHTHKWVEFQSAHLQKLTKILHPEIDFRGAFWRLLHSHATLKHSIFDMHIFTVFVDSSLAAAIKLYVLQLQSGEIPCEGDGFGGKH